MNDRPHSLDADTGELEPVSTSTIEQAEGAALEKALREARLTLLELSNHLTRVESLAQAPGRRAAALDHVFRAVDEARAMVEAAPSSRALALEPIGIVPTTKPPSTTIPTPPTTTIGGTGETINEGPTQTHIDMLLGDIRVIQYTVDDVIVTGRAVSALLRQIKADCDGLAGLLGLIGDSKQIAETAEAAATVAMIYPPASVVASRVRTICGRLAAILDKLEPAADSITQACRDISGVADTAAGKVDVAVAPVKQDLKPFVDREHSKYYDFVLRYPGGLPSSIDSCVAALHNALGAGIDDLRETGVRDKMHDLTADCNTLREVLDPALRIQAALRGIGDLLRLVIGPLKSLADLLEPLTGIIEIAGAVLNAVEDALRPLLNFLTLGIFDQIERLLDDLERLIDDQLDELKNTLDEAVERALAPVREFEARVQAILSQLVSAFAPLRTLFDTMRCWTP